MSEVVPARWHDAGWVIAVMHFPHEPALLNFMGGTPATTLWRAAEERERMAVAARRGVVAGHVLMALYAMAMSPWKIPEPSLKKAVHAAEQFSHVEQYADGTFMPEGRTKVRQCFDDMRPVAHLWAAFRIHREYPVVQHDQLLRHPEGIRALLGLARSIQSFALDWRPMRARSHVALLGDKPWLIPDDISSLQPLWSHEPDWLLKTITDYTR